MAGWPSGGHRIVPVADDRAHAAKRVEDTSDIAGLHGPERHAIRQLIGSIARTQRPITCHWLTCHWRWWSCLFRVTLILAGTIPPGLGPGSRPRSAENGFRLSIQGSHVPQAAGAIIPPPHAVRYPFASRPPRSEKSRWNQNARHRARCETYPAVRSHAPDIDGLPRWPVELEHNPNYG